VVNLLGAVCLSARFGTYFINVYLSGRNESKNNYKGRPCTYSVSGAPFACILTVYDRVHEEFVYTSYPVFRNNGVDEVASCVDVAWFILYR
jgi:hypothetical protein